MTGRPRRAGFVGGFLGGVLWALLVGGGALYLLSLSGLAVVSIPGLPGLHVVLDYIWVNLRLSLPVFVAVLLFYFLALGRLRRLLAAPAPALTDVVHAEHLVDTATGLFFGVGVIWTAIGMESALLYALGDPLAAAEAGAFAILQRLVEGGILLALSTTVVGGVGGYLLRLVKSLRIGAELQRFYIRAAGAQGREMIAVLGRIEQRLAAPAPAPVSKLEE